jgi:hypothetical protein
MKLGYMMLLVAVGAMLVIAPSAMGAKADKVHGDKNVVSGKVTKVEGAVITTAVKGQKGAAAEEKNITTTEKTTVVHLSKGADGKIEEKPGTMADVKEGVSVRVTLAEDGKTATKIAVMPAHEKKVK